MTTQLLSNSHGVECTFLAFLPCLYALQEGFLWLTALPSGHLYVVSLFKMDPLDILLELRKMEKNHTDSAAVSQPSCSSTPKFLSAKNFSILSELWIHVLSRHNSHLVSRTEWSNCCSTSLKACWLSVWHCGKNSQRMMLFSALAMSDATPEG